MTKTLQENTKDMSPAEVFRHINETYYCGIQGGVNDWRMELAHNSGLLSIRTRRNNHIENELYIYHVSYNFCGIERELYVSTYPKAVDEKLHNKDIYRAIHSNIRRYLDTEE